VDLAATARDTHSFDTPFVLWWRIGDTPVNEINPVRFPFLYAVTFLGIAFGLGETTEAARGV
jgi:hypothetical protein